MQDEIKFQNKPSETLIKRYLETINKFLSNIHAKVEDVRLYDYPIRIESYMNNELTDIANHWLDSFVIQVPQLRVFEIHPPCEGIDDEISDHSIWDDAFFIQNEVYHRLKKNPGNPKNNDPYWKLWDFLPKI